MTASLLPYVRRRRLAPGFFALGMLAACAFLALPLYLGGAATDTTRLLAFGGAGFCLAFTWQADLLTIVVTRETFAVGFRFFRTTTPLADLVRVARDDARVLDFGGAVRRGFAWTYVVATGPALFVRRRHGRPFVVTCDAPEEVLAALREAGAPAAALEPAS